MKKIQFLTVLLFTCSFIFAQDSSEPKKNQHEIGLDLTALADRFIGENNNVGFNRDYFLIYKSHKGKNTFRMRLGGGGSYYEESDRNYSQRNRKSESLNINLAFGLERRHHFSKKFSMNYGGELLYHWNYYLRTNVNDTGEYPEITSNNHQFGGQILIGLQYQISPRLWVGTEAFYRLSGSAEKMNFSFIVEDNDRSQKIWRAGGDFYPSGGIFLSFLF